MKYWFTPFFSGLMLTHALSFSAFGETKQNFILVYPPSQHQTTADQIFLIGTAPGAVSVNGKPIQQSASGHFAPSFPLKMGKNEFTLHYNNQEIKVQVTRISPVSTPPPEGGFASDSLIPSQPQSRLPEELICLEAVGSPQGEVSVTLNNQVIPLTEHSRHPLPPNYAVLTGNNPPLPQLTQLYQGCFRSRQVGNLGNPVYQMQFGDQMITASDTADITILDPETLPVVEVTAEMGATRTGPSTSYSRLTPLPQGTMAMVTGRDGDWLRLRYGAWIHGEETQVKPNATPTHTIIRSILGRQREMATEIVFPLQIPVPVSVKQGEETFSLTLHHTTAQTDTIRLDDDPLIKRLDWEQVTPETVQYTFHLKSEQQWGYTLRYEGSSLILSLKHPPETSAVKPLSGMSILLDPGHGGEELGARGPTGYPEKRVNLIVSKLLRDRLENLGATVYMTRETDKFVSLGDRIAMINEIQPAIALSLHYNALPDDGDALNTSGIGVFWYNPPAHDLAVFLHNYLVDKLDRASYGVFWNTLALTRPHTTLAVLLELGFMIHPTEFDWIVDPQAQEQLADTLAEGIQRWWEQKRRI